jgi:hypothetical protein
MNDDMSIEATEYVKRGIWLLRRSGLPERDPESWQSLWRAKYGSLDGFPYDEVGVERPSCCPTCGQVWGTSEP